MHTQEGREVMQIRIGMKLIRMTVMSKRVLMLPHDGIAQESHGPNARVVDPWNATGTIVTSIVSQGTKQPTTNRECKTRQDASL